MISNLSDAEFIGFIVGVTVGSIVVVVTIILLTYFFCCLKSNHGQKKKKPQSKANGYEQKSKTKRHNASYMENGHFKKEIPDSPQTKVPQSSHDPSIYQKKLPQNISSIYATDTSSQQTYQQQSSTKSSAGYSDKLSIPKSDPYFPRISIEDGHLVSSERKAHENSRRPWSIAEPSYKQAAPTAFHPNAFRLPGLARVQSFNYLENDNGKINPAYIPTEEEFNSTHKYNANFENRGFDPALRPMSKNIHNYRPASFNEDQATPTQIQVVARSQSAIKSGIYSPQYKPTKLRKFEIVDYDRSPSDTKFMTSLPNVSDPALFDNETTPSVHTNFSNRNKVMMTTSAHIPQNPPVMRFVRRESLPADTRSINSELFREKGKEITTDAFDFLNEYPDERTESGSIG